MRDARFIGSSRVHIEQYRSFMGNIFAGIVGALLGFSGALLGAWIKSKAELQQWLRDQMLAGAADLIRAGIHVDELRSGSDAALGEAEPTKLRDWQTRMQRSRGVVLLLYGEGTRRHADEFATLCMGAKRSDQAHYDKTIEHLQAFTNSLRSEIGIKRFRVFG